MKNLPVVLLIISLTFFSPLVMSQTIPNSDFENWTLSTLYEEPQEYNTLNSFMVLMQGTPGTTKSTDNYSGSYAVELTTTVAQGDTFPAMLLTGTMQNINRGIPYTERPDSVYIHAKHQLATGDTATGTFLFKTQSNTVLGKAQMKFYGNSSNYQLYAKKITWFPLPGYQMDTAIMIFSSGGKQNKSLTPGSSLTIDNLSFGPGYTDLPNSDFENWKAFEREKADYWFSMNSRADTGDTSFTKTSDHYSGSYAASLTTVETINGDTTGLLTNGRLSPSGLREGMATNANPATISGYYKYMPVGNDTALAGALSFVYNNANNSLIHRDSNMIKLPPANSFTRFEFSLNYDSLPIVDTLNLIFVSSNLINDKVAPSIGSELIIDSLNITYKPTGIQNNKHKNLRVYPNPARNYIEADLPKGKYQKLLIYNAIGKKLKEIPLGNNKHLKIPSAELSPGIVFLKFTGKSKDVIKKLIVK